MKMLIALALLATTLSAAELAPEEIVAQRRQVEAAMRVAITEQYQAIARTEAALDSLKAEYDSLSGDVFERTKKRAVAKRVVGVQALLEQQKQKLAQMNEYRSWHVGITDDMQKAIEAKEQK